MSHKLIFLWNDFVETYYMKMYVQILYFKLFYILKYVKNVFQIKVSIYSQKLKHHYGIQCSTDVMLMNKLTGKFFLLLSSSEILFF
jgi:hypothetical protein